MKFYKIWTVFAKQYGMCLNLNTPTPALPLPGGGSKSWCKSFEASADSYLVGVLKYVLNTRETNEAEVQEILEMLSRAIPEKSEQVITLADRLRYEGRQEGRQEEAYLIAKAMLRSGESDKKVMAYTGISSVRIAELKQELSSEEH